MKLMGNKFTKAEAFTLGCCFFLRKNELSELSLLDFLTELLVIGGKGVMVVSIEKARGSIGHDDEFNLRTGNKSNL